MGEHHPPFPPVNNMTPSLRGARFIPYLLLMCALVPYMFNLTGYFLSDDFVLLDWTHSHSLAALPVFFDTNTFWFYRPLLKVYFWVMQGLFGLNPTPFHLFSLLVHGLNGCLLYTLMLRHRASTGMAAAAALLFVLVPHHAETVSWIAATGDLLAVACILSALLISWQFMQQGKLLHLLLTTLLFALGLFTRETTIALPVLFALSVLIFNPRRIGEPTKKKLIRTIITLAGYGIVLITYTLVQLIGRTGSLVERGGLVFHSLDPESILLGIMDYVHGLLPGGSYLASLPLDVLRLVVWLEAFILVAVAFTLWKTGQRLALFGLAWMLITPVIFVPFSVPTDRYFYLPSIGYAIFVAGAVYSLLEVLVKWRATTSPRFVSATFTVVTALLIVLQLPSLLAHESDWRFAGKTSANVFSTTLHTIPDPHDYSAFFYTDLPLSLNGVPAFGNGLQQAVQLLYDNPTIAATSITCTSLQQAELPRYSYFFRYEVAGDVTQFTDKAGCAGP